MSGDALTLVVLAAGMGSRYGGMKQLDPVGPGGAPLMDYSVYDAWRSGFARVVFVIRPDMEDALHAFADTRFRGRVQVAAAHQRLDDVPVWVTVPPTRAKPWGTGHAVLAAQGAVDGPFAVVNADDFYGRRAFEAVSAFLRGDAGGRPPAYAVVGYRLRNTLSASGGVNRATCRATPEGWLTAIEEVQGIAAAPAGAFAGRARTGPVTLTGDDLVSMNMWAFTPAVFDTLRHDFAEFLGSRDLTKDEFLLPAAIAAAARRRAARVRVLDPRSHWWGVTYADDRPRVAEAMRRLVAEGSYPERLWG